MRYSTGYEFNRNGVRKWLYIFTACAVLAVIFFIFYNPYTGPDFLDEPMQVLLDEPISIVFAGRDGPVTLELLAAYQIEAAVKSKRSYVTDYPSQISPLDLVLAWGDLNQPQIDQHIRYSQLNRWYFFQYNADSPVDQAYIQLHSANVHLIPENKQIERQLKRIRKNDLVTLEGYLVKANFVSGVWTSSLTRHDSGDASCEIMYVQAVSR